MLSRPWATLRGSRGLVVECPLASWPAPYSAAPSPGYNLDGPTQVTMPSAEPNLYETFRTAPYFWSSVTEYRPR